MTYFGIEQIKRFMEQSFTHNKTRAVKRHSASGGVFTESWAGQSHVTQGRRRPSVGQAQPGKRPQTSPYLLLSESFRGIRGSDSGIDPLSQPVPQHPQRASRAPCSTVTVLASLSPCRPLPSCPVRVWRGDLGAKDKMKHSSRRRRTGDRGRGKTGKPAPGDPLSRVPRLLCDG